MGLRVVLCLVASLAIAGCASKPAAAPPPPAPPPKPETYALTEIAPPEKVAVEVKEVKKDPVYLGGRVVEIEVVKGVQRFLFLKFSDESKDVKPNTKGEIFLDEKFERKVGEFTVLQKYPSYYYAEITDLITAIDRNSFVRVQIE